jgi:hypothetical protein
VHDVVRDVVLLDVPVDLRLVVGVVAQRVEDLGEVEVSEMSDDLLGRCTQAPELDDGAHRGPGGNDDRLRAEDGVVADDVC